MNPQGNKTAYFTKKAAAVFAGGVSVKTVSGWLEMGLPYVQIRANGRILIKVGDLEQFLNSKRMQRGTLLDDLVEATLKEMDF